VAAVTDDFLAVYTVYFNPTDFPGRYVVRRFLVHPNDPRPDPSPMHVGDTLDSARDAIPPGLIRFSAGDEDDMSIIESWM
jgi:hypothetical protein